MQSVSQSALPKRNAMLSCTEKSLEAQSRAAAGGRLKLRASPSRQGVDSLQIRV
ncbi:unnamed protein product, partial [Rangifer tarandus platyrhynchus]|uniref:Uncharacterized protein n=1 Tax=Rangifer tarandus platyrhynchus TaxID=3082113 RepID=A0ACB1MJE4_RANTA